MMKITQPTVSLLGAAALVLVTSLLSLPASATLLETDTTQGTAFTVVSGDLLEASGTTHTTTLTSNGTPVNETNASTGAGSITYSDNSDTGSFIGVPSVTNGSFGTLPATEATPKVRSEFIGVTSNITITFSLDLGASAAGYDISQFGIYTAWNNNGRDGINVGISYATVSAPTTFTLLTTAAYNPSIADHTPVANRAIISDSVGGVLATGVSAIRFTFAAQENNGVGYRELDVVGAATAVPEPSSTLLGLLGGAGLLAMMRRRSITA